MALALLVGACGSGSGAGDAGGDGRPTDPTGARDDAQDPEQEDDGGRQHPRERRRWVDAKGNDWRIEGNVGVNSPVDGFQMHEIREGWGTGNVFAGNSADVNGSGHGFATTNTQGNVISCDNEVVNAGEGFADVDCSSQGSCAEATMIPSDRVCTRPGEG